MVWSRRIFALEAALIVVPYGLFALYAYSRMLFDAPTLYGWRLPVAIVLVPLTALPLIAGGVLSWNFLSGGRTRLSGVAARWWNLAYLGSFYPAIGLIAFVLEVRFGKFYLGPLDADPPRIGAFVVGILVAPLLIPLIHLSFERRMAASNYRLERP